MELRGFSGSRGIQQEDVWSAADSLIADGLKPTIERVRQKIGRGSPNTVSPMLEAWFANLGTRLGVNKEHHDESDDIPKAFQQALKNAWVVALSKGREESALEIAQRQAELMQASQVLSKRETEMAQTEQLRAVKQQTLEDALKVARDGTEDAFSRLSEAQELTNRREHEIQNLHKKLAVVEKERGAERQRNQEATAEYIRERQKVDERAQGTQLKSLEEIDRARQETKKISIETEASKKKFFEDKIFLEEKNRLLEDDFVKLHARYAAKSSDVDALRQASAVSESRSDGLENLLKAQLADSKNTITRLTEALLAQADRPLAGSRLLIRTLKRTSSIRKR